MALAQFLLPGEEVRYESAGEVRCGRTPYTLYITGERLLLHTVAGRFGAREGVIAESLSDVDSLEYEEGGFLFERGRLRIRFHHDSITLTGEPVVMKEVWQQLQQHTFRTPAGPADEVTLVVPPAPLFDDQQSPPARVQPLPSAPTQPPYRQRQRPASASRLLFVLAAACLAVLFAAAAYKFRHRFTSGGGSQQAAVTPTPTPPTPAPTPLSVQIMDEVFTLEEGAHRAVKFTIPAGQPPARLSGGFRVTAGNYIDFYLMSEGQYDRFAAGDPPDVSSAVYRKDQWNARVGERLAAGGYYLVFDNSEGEDGPQTVAGQFVVVFD